MSKSHVLPITLLVGLVCGIAAAAPSRGGPSNSRATGTAAPCASPTKEVCLATGYLATACGKQHAQTCMPFVLAAIDHDPTRLAAPQVKALRPNLDQIPRDLVSARTFDYAGPAQQRGRALRAKHLLAATGLTTRPLAHVDPAIAAKAHRNPGWDANGQKVASCAEYGYEQVYDYARFTDAVAACRGDSECELAVAYLPSTPGIARRVLKRTDGKPLSQLAVHTAGTIPKNEMFAYGLDLIYAGGPTGVPQTPELDAARAAIKDGQNWYSFGCKGRCGPRAFGTEWDFHEKLHVRNAAMSTAEFEEFDRRKHEFAELVRLHAAAVAQESIKQKVAVEVRWKEFDVTMQDPLERIQLMKRLDVQRKHAISKRRATPVRRTPRVGAAPRTMAAGVLAAPVTRGKPGNVVPSKPHIDVCAPSHFAMSGKPVTELGGYGPISCRIGEFLRAELARKAEGQKSCLDLADDDCDWSPSMFRKRFVGSLDYLDGQARHQTECSDWTGDNFASTPKKDLIAAEKDMAEMKAAVSAAMKELKPYEQGTTSAGKRFGREWGDAEGWGDADRFRVGYDYGLGWEVAPIALGKLGTQQQICQLAGHAGGHVKVSADLAGHHKNVVDGRLHASVQGAKAESSVTAHLKVLGIDVFTPVEETYDLVFTETYGAESIGFPKPKPSFTFMAGPIPVTVSAWAALSYAAELSGEGKPTTSCDPNQVAFGLKTVFEPHIGLVGRAQAGIGVPGVSAGVRGTVSMIELSVPVGVDLATALRTIGGQPQWTLVADVAASLSLSTLSGKVSLYLEYLFGEDEWGLFEWKGLGPKEIPLMKPFHAELPLLKMK